MVTGEVGLRLFGFHSCNLREPPSFPLFSARVPFLFYKATELESFEQSSIHPATTLCQLALTVHGDCGMSRLRKNSLCKRATPRKSLRSLVKATDLSSLPRESS